MHRELQAQERPLAGWTIALVAAMAIFVVPHVVDRFTPNTWLVGDGGFYLNMQKTLTRHGTLNQESMHPHSWYEGDREVSDAFSNISLGKNGEWWPKHSYLMPVVALPFYWMFGPTGTLVFNVAVILMLVSLSYRLARCFTSDGAAAGAALLVGVAGPMMEYSYNFSNDAFYSCLLMAGLVATAERRVLLGGLFFGFALWSKVTSVLLGPAFAILLLRDGFKPKDLLRFTAASMVGVTGLLVSNWLMFGAPWITSYERVLVVKDGALTVASHTKLFGTPFYEGLEELLLGDKEGLLNRFPVLVFSVLGLLGMLWTRGRRAAGAAGLITMTILIGFYAKFDYYEIRFLLPLFGIAPLGIAPLLSGLAGARLPARITRPPVRWVAMGAAIVAILALRASLGDDDARLSNRLETARVFIGDRHCDYFNNMRWAWECPRDRSDLEYVGTNAAHTPTFNGREVPGLICLSGHNTRASRRLVFPAAPGHDRLILTYGLDDRSRAPAKVELAVHVAGRAVYDATVTTPGVQYYQSLDLRAIDVTDPDIVLTISTNSRRRARFCIDGRLE